jgi:alpha-tubulin suppressor-like RCC1 family protein
VGGSAITGYVATAKKTSDGTTISGTGSSSPVTISGLTTSSAYTVTVAAVNSYGLGVSSAASNSVTPLAQELYSWGDNSYGQLGLEDTVARSSPVQVGALNTWVTVAAMRGASGAIKKDGTLWTWGANSAGQLGLGDASGFNRSSPVQVGALTTWSKLSAGSYDNGAGSHFLAVKTDGTMWAWGQNTKGQLGQNDTDSRSSPVQIGALTGWAEVAAGVFSSLAVKTNGTLWSWGQNEQGQLGLGTANPPNGDDRSSPVQIGALTTWSKVAMSRLYAAAIKTNGTLWMWGLNTNAQLGLGDTVSRSSPVQVGALTTWAAVSVTTVSTFAVKTDGTMWAWGYNGQGRLGLNISSGSRSSPVQIGALTDWSKVSANVRQASPYGGVCLAIKTDGTLWSWGNNISGVLGLGDAAVRSSPVQVGSLTTWANISAGNATALATTEG